MSKTQRTLSKLYTGWRVYIYSLIMSVYFISKISICRRGNWDVKFDSLHFHSHFHFLKTCTIMNITGHTNEKKNHTLNIIFIESGAIYHLYTTRKDYSSKSWCNLNLIPLLLECCALLKAQVELWSIPLTLVAQYYGYSQNTRRCYCWENQNTTCWNVMKVGIEQTL